MVVVFSIMIWYRYCECMKILITWERCWSGISQILECEHFEQPPKKVQSYTELLLCIHTFCWNFMITGELTYDAVCIFLLKPGQRWEYEAQSGHHDKHARDHCYHLVVVMITMVRGLWWWWWRWEDYDNDGGPLKYFFPVYVMLYANGKREELYVRGQIWQQKTFICK